MPKIVRIVIINILMLKFLNFSLKFCNNFFYYFGVFRLFNFMVLFDRFTRLQKIIKLSTTDFRAEFTQKNSKLIAEYAIEKRLFIPYESIPDKVINAFLSAEDKNFFSHPGIDAKGILRAIIKNIKNISQNKRLEGASTITQQVAKNFYLRMKSLLKER